MIRDVSSLEILKNALTQVSKNPNISSATPLSIEVLEKLDLTKYLIKLGGKTIEATSQHELQANTKYWAEAKNEDNKTVNLQNVLKKPDILQNFSKLLETPVAQTLDFEKIKQAINDFSNVQKSTTEDSQAKNILKDSNKTESKSAPEKIEPNIKIALNGSKEQTAQENTKQSTSKQEKYETQNEITLQSKKDNEPLKLTKEQPQALDPSQKTNKEHSQIKTESDNLYKKEENKQENSRQLAGNSSEKKLETNQKSSLETNEAIKTMRNELEKAQEQKPTQTNEQKPTERQAVEKKEFETEKTVQTTKHKESDQANKSSDSTTDKKVAKEDESARKQSNSTPSQPQKPDNMQPSLTPKSKEEIATSLKNSKSDEKTVETQKDTTQTNKKESQIESHKDERKGSEKSSTIETPAREDSKLQLQELKFEQLSGDITPEQILKLLQAENTEEESKTTEAEIESKSKEDTEKEIKNQADKPISVDIKNDELEKIALDKRNIEDEQHNRHENKASSDTPAAKVKNEILNEMTRSEQKEQFQMFSNVALNLNRGGFTAIIRGDDEKNGVVQFRKKARVGQNSPQTIEFYSAFEHLGPIAGEIWQHNNQTYLSLDVEFESTAKLLTKNLGHLQFFDKKNVTLRHGIEQLFEIKSSMLNIIG